MTVKEKLLAIRHELIERLRGLDPNTVAELDRIDRALNAIDPQDIPLSVPGEFAGIDIVDAIKIYLTRVKREATVDEIHKALIYGGAGDRGERAASQKINQSISFHVGKSLTRNGDLIGLREWVVKS